MSDLHLRLQIWVETKFSFWPQRFLTADLNSGFDSQHLGHWSSVTLCHQTHPWLQTAPVTCRRANTRRVRLHTPKLCQLSSARKTSGLITKAYCDFLIWLLTRHTLSPALIHENLPHRHSSAVPSADMLPRLASSLVYSLSSLESDTLRIKWERNKSPWWRSRASECWNQALTPHTERTHSHHVPSMPPLHRLHSHQPETQQQQRRGLDGTTESASSLLKLRRRFLTDIWNCTPNSAFKPTSPSFPRIRPLTSA